MGFFFNTVCTFLVLTVFLLAMTNRHPRYIIKVKLKADSETKEVKNTGSGQYDCKDDCRVYVVNIGYIQNTMLKYINLDLLLNLIKHENSYFPWC